MTYQPPLSPEQATEALASYDVLTMTEAAKRLRVSRWMIFRLVQAKTLQTFTVGTRRFVTSADLQAYIDRRRAEGDQR